MKKVLLTLLVGCLAFGVTTAQTTKGPQIEFTKTEHDYGTIANGADGSCEFKFKNTGKEPLLISNCQASCGCTVPAWPREAIAPGKTETIKVVYDTKRTGGIYKTITVTSNAINEPSKTLTIKGTVNAPVATEVEGIQPAAVPAPIATPPNNVAVEIDPTTPPVPEKAPTAKKKRVRPAGNKK